MWFLFSLFSILAWSGSDLFSKIGSRPDDKYSHWKMVMAVGLVMGLHALYEMTVGGVRFDWNAMLVYLPVSALYILSMIFGYCGLRYIELSISSPICNSSGAITAILCFLILHQKISGIQFVGVLFICLGVLGLSFLESSLSKKKEPETKETAKYTRSFLAILFPILYCIIDGLGTFADALVLDSGRLAEVQANIAYELTFFGMAVFAFCYVVLYRRQKIAIRKEGSKLTAAVCETAGQFTYIFAIADNAILAAPTIASYSIFSVLWSRLFLKEKLSKKHYAVILIVVAGIFILGME